MTATHLLDTSVWGRLRTGQDRVGKRLRPMIERGLLATCPLLDLEAGYSARSPEEHAQILADRSRLYPWVPMPDDAFTRVLAIQRDLVARGTHRGVGMPDLLIAATATAHGLRVLHYDHDFDLIGDVDAVDGEWIMPRGSLDG